jgi:hypothetical protein
MVSNMGYRPPPPPIPPYGETHIWYKYKRKFAVLPKKCIGNRWVWLGVYYKKYMVFSYKEINDIMYFKYSITEEDLIIEKLKEGI